MRRFEVPVTTSAGGAATGYTPTVDGKVQAIRYVPDGTSPLDTDADITVTGEASGIPILSATNIGTSATQWYPRAPIVDSSNAAGLYAAGGEAVLGANSGGRRGGQDRRRPGRQREKRRVPRLRRVSRSEGRLLVNDYDA
jgi:hypothetical protein